MIPGKTNPSRRVIFSPLDLGSDSSTSVKMPSFTRKHLACGEEKLRVVMENDEGLETQYRVEFSMSKKLATSAMKAVHNTAKAARPLEGGAIVALCEDSQLILDCGART